MPPYPLCKCKHFFWGCTCSYNIYIYDVNMLTCGAFWRFHVATASSYKLKLAHLNCTCSFSGLISLVAALQPFEAQLHFFTASCVLVWSLLSLRSYSPFWQPTLAMLMSQGWLTSRRTVQDVDPSLRGWGFFIWLLPGEMFFVCSQWSWYGMYVCSLICLGAITQDLAGNWQHVTCVCEYNMLLLHTWNLEITSGQLCF